MERSKPGGLTNSGQHQYFLARRLPIKGKEFRRNQRISHDVLKRCKYRNIKKVATCNSLHSIKWPLESVQSVFMCLVHAPNAMLFCTASSKHYVTFIETRKP